MNLYVVPIRIPRDMCHESIQDTDCEKKIRKNLLEDRPNSGFRFVQFAVYILAIEHYNALTQLLFY